MNKVKTPYLIVPCTVYNLFIINKWNNLKEIEVFKTYVEVLY
jgi:hypothetical protein